MNYNELAREIHEKTQKLKWSYSSYPKDTEATALHLQLNNIHDVSGLIEFAMHILDFSFVNNFDVCIPRGIFSVARHLLSLLFGMAPAHLDEIIDNFHDALRCIFSEFDPSMQGMKSVIVIYIVRMIDSYCEVHGWDFKELLQTRLKEICKEDKP